jgi:hypothetical protein
MTHPQTSAQSSIDHPANLSGVASFSPGAMASFSSGAESDQGAGAPVIYYLTPGPGPLSSPWLSVMGALTTSGHAEG